MFFKKRRKIDLTESDKQSFLAIMSNIESVLNRSQLRAQEKAVNDIARLLLHNDYEDFLKEINGASMWGGAGAVWEVYIEDKALAIELQKEMIRLIDFMEAKDILGKGIKSIRSILQENNVR